MITIENVKELRNKTGASLDDCKNFLTLCDNDVEIAFEAIRYCSQAITRYKIVNGVQIQKDKYDLIEMAKRKVEDRRKQNETK